MEADNVDISKRFMALHIDYLSAGFIRRNFSRGNSPISLYICMIGDKSMAFGCVQGGSQTLPRGTSFQSCHD